MINQSSIFHSPAFYGEYQNMVQKFLIDVQLQIVLLQKQFLFIITVTVYYYYYLLLLLFIVVCFLLLLFTFNIIDIKEPLYIIIFYYFM
jgi:hypothetical protein